MTSERKQFVLDYHTLAFISLQYFLVHFFKILDFLIIALSFLLDQISHLLIKSCKPFNFLFRLLEFLRKLLKFSFHLFEFDLLLLELDICFFMIFYFLLDLLCEDFIVLQKFLAFSVIELLFTFKNFVFLF